jgi:hypothetical protein
MKMELGMTREEAWKLMNAYRTGLPWTAEHVMALRLLIDEDFDKFEQIWSSKGNSWACIHDLIKAIIRSTDSQRIPA